MSQTTTNLQLVKPELTDNITPTIFAENFEKIDAAVGEINSNLNGMKYYGGSIGVPYNSANQLGVAVDVSELKASVIHSFVACITYTESSATAIQKVDRIVTQYSNSNILRIYLYADDNDFSSSDVVTVSWTVCYN